MMNCTWCDLFFSDEEKIIIRSKEHRKNECFVKQYTTIKQAATDFKNILLGSCPISEKWETPDQESELLKNGSMSILNCFTAYKHDTLENWLKYNESEINKTGIIGKTFLEYLK